ncbi:MAG: hypothetical protein QOH97_4888 [Actinoplanes sp.]|jgi:predicted amidophosphoribosyltransferase|nr:hypothetical protein [Actinoplanes sp.]
MASFASIVTVSARQNTRYVECIGCGKTAALTRRHTHCPRCVAEPQRVTRRPARAA